MPRTEVRQSSAAVSTPPRVVLLHWLGWVCVLLAVLAIVPLQSFQTSSGTQPKRHIVFLLDLSGSMVNPNDPITKQPRKATLQQELEGAQARAAQILESVASASDVDVSFWTFGERDRFARLGSLLTPAEALGQLAPYFSPTRPRFSHQRTYIAHSLFRVTGEVLGLGNWTPDRDIPTDGGSVFAFVLTDGAEDFGEVFNNAPYVEWQQRQQNRTQLVWRKWTLFDERKDWSDPATADRVSYAIIQMLPTVSPLNLSRLPGDNLTNFDRIPSQIVLVPQVLADASQSMVHANGDYRPVARAAAPCEIPGAPVNVPARSIQVQAQVDWRPAGPAQDTPPWRLDAPARESTQQSLTLSIGGKPGAAIPTAGALEAGQRFPVRLNRDQLCAELKLTYPGSSFIFPHDDAEEPRLPPVGVVEVFRRPVYRFTLSTLDGTVPTAAFEPVSADRWHVYNRVVRRYRLTSESPVDAQVDFVTTVLRDGAPVADALPMATLQPERQATSSGGGLSLTVPIGEVVSLSIPPSPQTWLDATTGRGFRWPPGQYTMHVCALPRLGNLPEDSYEVETTCEGCAADATTTENGGLCTNATVAIGAMPWSWWTIAGLVIAITMALWAWWRWVTRPRFRPRLQIGILSEARDLRSAQEGGPGGAWATFMRRPGYMELLAGGRSVYMRKFFVDQKTNRNVVLGVSPNPATPQVDFLVWCGATPAQVPDVRVMCGGRNLSAAGPKPDPFGPLVVHVSYSSLPTAISVHTVDGQVAGSYRIELS